MRGHPMTYATTTSGSYVDEMLAGWRAGANNEPIQPFLGIAWCRGWQQQRLVVATKSFKHDVRAEIDEHLAEIERRCRALANLGGLATDLARAACEIALSDDDSARGVQ